MTIKRLTTLSFCLLLSLLAACDQGDLGIFGGLQANIVSFTAEPTSIQAGESTTLKWIVLGGSKDLPITLVPGNVELSRSGSYQINPDKTTTYTLVAGSEGKAVTKEVTVNVAGETSTPVPPTTEPPTSAPNQAPVISDIPDQTMILGDTLTVPFTIIDDNFEGSQLGISLVSDPAGILPNLAKSSGQDGNYTLELTPLGVGTVELSLSTRDAEGLSDEVQFAVTVEPRGDDSFDPDYVGTFEFEPNSVLVEQPTMGFLNLPDSVDCSISVNGADPYEVDCVGYIRLTPEKVGTTNVEINAFKASGFHIFLKGSVEVTEKGEIEERLVVTTKANTPVSFELPDIEVPNYKNTLFDIETYPTHGDLKIDSLGFFYGCCVGSSVTYTPDEGFTGVDSLTYQVVLGGLSSGKSVLAYGKITINVVADTPDPDASCESQIVNIKDLRLRSAVHSALNVSFNDDVTCAQIGTLTTLDASGGDFKGSITNAVSDLSGIEYAINLKELDLSRNLIDDFSLLGSLPKLETLSFVFGSAPSFEILSSVKELKSLNLTYTGIQDLSGIEALTSLEELYLYDTQLKDISPLLALPWAGKNDIVDLSGASGIPAEQIEALKQKVETVKLKY